MFCPVPIVQVASFNHVLTVNFRNEARQILTGKMESLKVSSTN